MSWIFGKKKHQKDSPPDSNDEGELIEAPPPDPVQTYPSPASYPTGGLYPQIDNVGTYTPMPLPNLSNQNAVVTDTTHYLSGVPFKLCKQLESNLNDDLVVDLIRVDEILSYIERLNNENLEYDFSLEESVIAELNSRTGE